MPPQGIAARDGGFAAGGIARAAERERSRGPLRKLPGVAASPPRPEVCRTLVVAGPEGCETTRVTAVTGNAGRGVVSLLFAAVFCAACAWPQSPAGAGAQPEGFRQVAIGLCEDYPEEARSLASARRDLELLRHRDIRVLRIAFGWDAMQPERGRWDWSFWDEFVRMAVDEFQIRLIPYVCYTPEWASRAAGDPDFWRHPPQDNRDFAVFLSALVSRYRDRIESWEIWNEPDNPAYWSGSVEEFAALLEAGAQAVRQAAPRSRVVLGGLAWDLGFLQSLLEDREAMEHVDVINLHNYHETWSSEPVERLPDYLGRARDLIEPQGRQREIWMAELGYSSFRRGPWVSGQFRAFYEHEHRAAHQAASLFRMLTLVLASEAVTLAAWYRIHDLPEAQEVIGDVNNRHLGVLDERGKPKPALAALQFFQRLFREGFRCLDHEVRIEKEIASPAEVHVFLRPGGSRVVVAWVRTYVAGQRGRDASGTVEDLRRPKVALEFPHPLASPVEVFHEDGVPQGDLALPAASRRLDLELVPGRVTVLVLRPAG